MLSRDNARFLPLHRVIVSQAITGEMVGIENYARMIPMAIDVDARLAILEDAWHEAHHVRAMQEVARELDIDWMSKPNDVYWGRVRAAFDDCATRGDLLACTVIQDIVIECYAVILYEAIQAGVEPFIAASIGAIVEDERRHLARGVEALRGARLADPRRAADAVETANEQVARVLCEWTEPSDCEPICGVCGAVSGVCAKRDLELIDVHMPKVRAQFTSLYGRALRDSGFPPSAVTRWVARLST